MLSGLSIYIVRRLLGVRFSTSPCWIIPVVLPFSLLIVSSSCIPQYPTAPTVQVWEVARDLKSKFCNDSADFTVQVIKNKTASLGEPDLILDSSTYLKELVKLTQCNFPSRSTALIWGPKSSGKTFGLQLIDRLCTDTERLVFTIDLKGFSGSYQDFLRHVGRVISERIGPEDTRLKWEDRVFLITHRKRMEPSNAINILDTMLRLTIANPLLRDWQPVAFVLDWVLQTYTAWSAVKAEFDTAREAIDTMWAARYSTTDLQSCVRGLHFIDMLDMFEELARVRPDLAPVVIIREVQRLQELQHDSNGSGRLQSTGNNFLQTLFRKLEARKQGESVIPILMETSDWSFANQTRQSVLESSDSYKYLYVGPLNEVELRHETVGAQRLDGNQFNVIWKAIGGHAGSWARLFRDISMPTTINRTDSINESIQLQRQEAYEKLHRALYPAKASNEIWVNTSKQFLVDFHSAGYRINHDGWFHSKVARELVRKNILFADPNGTLIPQNQLYRYAIEEFLTKTNLTTSKQG